MSIITESDLARSMRDAGLLGAGELAEFVPLTGGISSDITLVRGTDGRQFVVKRALAKLKVRDDWFADPQRNQVEQAYFTYVGSFAPAVVPRLLHRGENWFAMEYLGGDLANWKTALMAGRANPMHAQLAGDFLGRVHRVSWSDAKARTTFATGKNFYDLRIEPYLVTTGRRLPEYRERFEAEAARLAGCALALVHGDYSPKNLLVSGSRLVALDAEVAWFGDPAFDLAFLLTHLHLKALVHAAQPQAMLGLIPIFWERYQLAVGAQADGALEARMVRLTLMLMLARVHGKSPAEYLASAQRDTVTRFASAQLRQSPDRLTDLTAAWATAIVSP